jgi:AcrR family transcriptional regulator
MTDRQEKILASGLELFATKGYHATSTNEVAKHAGVSEGLIFRHFTNKDGLLKAILLQCEQKVKQLYQEVIDQPTAKQVVSAFLQMPFKVPETEYSFWKLLFTLKSELSIDNSEKIKPLKHALTNAFHDLSYTEPEMEAQFIIHYIDGLIGALLKGETKATPKLKKFLLAKYNI